MALAPMKLRDYLTGAEKPYALHLWTLGDLVTPLTAAIGDIELLQNTLSLPNLLPPHCELFPNALGAAVAADQWKALKSSSSGSLLTSEAEISQAPGMRCAALLV
jgi:hypothetical protein